MAHVSQRGKRAETAVGPKHTNAELRKSEATNSTEFMLTGIVNTPYEDSQFSLMKCLFSSYHFLFLYRIYSIIWKAMLQDPDPWDHGHTRHSWAAVRNVSWTPTWVAGYTLCSSCICMRKELGQKWSSQGPRAVAYW